MKIRIGNVKFKDSINLGAEANKPGEPQFESRTYLKADRHKVQMQLDTDTRVLWVFVEGARREFSAIPMEACELLEPLQEPSTVAALDKALGFAREKSKTKLLEG